VNEPLLGLRGLRLLVTGGTGFVGSAFVRHAVAGGAAVTVLDRENSDHWRLQPVDGHYARLTASLAELASGEKAPPDGIDALVHLAAAGVDQSFDDIATLVATNVTGTLHALQGAQRLGVRRFVLVGSSGEYGPGIAIDETDALRPTSEYGASRASATLLARAFGARRGLDVVTVRPFAVYGPFEAAYRLVPYAILGGLRGEPLRISSGAQTRDYVHVDDVADGLARACCVEAAGGGTFNLCSGTETRVLDAVERLAVLTGGRSAVEAGARAPIAGEMWRTSGAPTRARAVLGWSPRWALDEGLERTVGWFREVGGSLPAYAQAR